MGKQDERENMAVKNIILSIRNVKKNFQIGKQTVEVLKNIDLDVKEGEFVSIIGSSGCGKSTLLKLITALDAATSGEIRIDGEKVVKPSPKCSMIFQEARLFPWLSAGQNIVFTLPAGVSREEKNRIVKEHISLVGLEGFETALPSQLSGGMQQRVSIARGLATKPRLLLLDEPFGALDAFTRIDLQEELLNIWEREKTTMLMVTHDIDEAIYLSDRIIVLSAKPGIVKADIEINLPRPRERSSYEFLQIRRNVLKALFEKEGAMREVEYYI